MQTLYLHGLEAKPSLAKLKILEKQLGKGKIIMPELNYLQPYESLWHELQGWIAQHEIEFLVGSSYGGFWAYWLGQAFGLPQLLFNPAVGWTEQMLETDLPIGPGFRRGNLVSYVVLGAQDEVVPPQLSRDFFASEAGARVLTCEWLGHRIDLQTFSEMVAWALHSHSLR